MKVWITKYAFTTGIYEAEARLCDNGSETMIEVKTNGLLTQYFHGKDWHKDKASALVRLAEMKEKKIASLKKQIKKIESMTI